MKKGFSKYRERSERSFLIGIRKLDGVNEGKISKDAEEEMGYCKRVIISKLKLRFLDWSKVGKH